MPTPSDTEHGHIPEVPHDVDEIATAGETDDDKDAARGHQGCQALKCVCQANMVEDGDSGDDVEGRRPEGRVADVSDDVADVVAGGGGTGDGGDVQVEARRLAYVLTEPPSRFALPAPDVEASVRALRHTKQGTVESRRIAIPPWRSNDHVSHSAADGVDGNPLSEIRR